MIWLRSAARTERRALPSIADSIRRVGALGAPIESGGKPHALHDAGATERPAWIGFRLCDEGIIVGLAHLAGQPLIRFLAIVASEFFFFRIPF